MTTAASDESPAPVDKPRLFKLAIACLLLSAVVQTACLAVAHNQFAPPGTTFVGIDSTYFVASAIVIWICAQSSAIVPAVLSAQGYRILLVLSLAFGLIGVLVDMIFGGGKAGPGLGVALAVSLFAGSLLATAQTAIWERFGWHLVRIRHDRTSPAG